MAQLSERGWLLTPEPSTPTPPSLPLESDKATLRSRLSQGAIGALRAVYQADAQTVAVLSPTDLVHADLVDGVTVTSTSGGAQEIIVCQEGIVFDAMFNWIEGRRVFVAPGGLLTQAIDTSWPILIPVGVAVGPKHLHVDLTMDAVELIGP